MTANAHLYPQLDAFAAISKPGYALMVDAPWGVGKSHALRRWMTQRKDCLYVSLYGAVDGNAIEEALFDALIAKNKSLKPPKGTALAEAMTEKWAGFRIDITGAYRRQAMRSLPRILIFDDLERTEMPPNQLLGRLNQFVEHDPRNVILIAHQEKLRVMSDSSGYDYDSIREKVIGRAISMLPEADAALEAFLGELKEQSGGLRTKVRALLRDAGTLQKQDAIAFLTQERAIITSTFKDSSSPNLRLLRQAMLEFSRFHAQIPQDIRSNQSGMKHILATFIALAIAYHGGNGFKARDLAQEAGWARALWQVNGREDAEPEKTGLEQLQERYKENSYARIDGTVISGALAIALIQLGFAADAFVAQELRKAPLFAIEHYEAWQTLWWWPKRSEKEVADALQLVKNQLKEKAIRDEIVILHLGGIVLDLADNMIGWETREKAKKEIIDYISLLEKERLLAADQPKGGYNHALFDRSTFGLEIRQKNTEEFKEICAILVDALDRRFWSENKERGKNLLELAKSDAESFSAVIDNTGRRSGLPNYAHWPVMTGIDPAIAAKTIFSLPADQIGHILAPFKNRIQRLEALAVPGQNSNWPSERDWLLKVRSAAEQLASSENSPIRAAQIRTMIRWNLGFLDDV